MFSINVHRNFKRFGIVLSLALGFMMLSVMNAHAQYRDPNYYPQGSQNDQDRREHRRENRDDRDRNNGNYNRGDRDNDQRYERNRRSDNDYGNYGYGNNFYRMAQQYGYQDGLNKGAEEAREGDRYNPQGTSPYKNAANGYDRSYGNREQYKQTYRQAFLQGFDQGYNQYNRSNRNGNYNNRHRRGY